MMKEQRCLLRWVVAITMGLSLVVGCEAKQEETKENSPSLEKEREEAEKVVEKAPEPPPVEEPSEAELLKARLELPEGMSNPPAEAETTSSKIRWVQLEQGDGTDSPKGDDVFWVHYVSWDETGRRKGNTVKDGKAKQMRMKKTLAGWSEMLSEMSVGERRRVWLPAKLAHPRKAKVKDPKDRRILDLQLVKLNRAPSAPKTVRRAPKDAEKLKSGLAWMPLTEAQGETRPGPDSEVVVKYAGWTTDGSCFDFTGEGETFSTRLDQVIPGWTQGIRLLSPGQKGRFWIPENLAYKGSRGKPKGMLVFDVELVEIR